MRKRKKKKRKLIDGGVLRFVFSSSPMIIATMIRIVIIIPTNLSLSRSSDQQISSDSVIDIRAGLEWPASQETTYPEVERDGDNQPNPASLLLNILIFSHCYLETAAFFRYCVTWGPCLNRPIRARLGARWAPGKKIESTCLGPIQQTGNQSYAWFPVV